MLHHRHVKSEPLCSQKSEAFDGMGKKKEVCVCVFVSAISASVIKFPDHWSLVSSRSLSLLTQMSNMSMPVDVQNVLDFS